MAQVNAVHLLQKLLSFDTVTPEDAGCLTYITDVLRELGFTCEEYTFSEDGTPDVKNLFAYIGSAPYLCFAGHVDVVAPLKISDWRHHPFAGQVEEGVIYGRGVVDMKGAIAAFIAAVAEYLSANPQANLAFLLTGDEEGPAINGTAKLLEVVSNKGHTFSHVLVGEPSSNIQVGDCIKIGRRGSASYDLTIFGQEGHVAFPHLVRNPIHLLVSALDNIIQYNWGDATEFFDPASVQIVILSVDNETINLVPDKAKASFNIRFNDMYTLDIIEGKLREILAPYQYTLQPRDGNSNPSITLPDRGVQILQDAIKKETGISAVVSTAGGTSDARFIQQYAPVFEFGLLNATAHKIDEHAALHDIYLLQKIYISFINKYFL